MTERTAPGDSGRRSGRGLLIAAVVLLAVSGWLLWTLVIEEGPYIEHDRNAIVDHTFAIGLPALAGLAVAALALRRMRRR